MVKISTDGKCRFYEKKHVYKVGKKVYTSVTTLIHKHFKPFDEKGLARKLAKFGWAKKQRKGVRYWLREFKKSREQGTLCHEELEIYVKNPVQGDLLYPVYHPRSKVAVDWYKSIIESKYSGYHPEPELLIYNEDYQVAGQIDLPLINGNKVVICDYKFTSRIKKDPYDDGDYGITSITKDLPNCNYTQYSLQLSMYAYLMELKGFIVEALHLVHISPSGELTVHDIPYMRDVVIKLLEDKNGKEY